MVTSAESYHFSDFNRHESDNTIFTHCLPILRSQYERQVDH